MIEGKYMSNTNYKNYISKAKHLFSSFIFL